MKNRVQRNDRKCDSRQPQPPNGDPSDGPHSSFRFFGTVKNWVWWNECGPFWRNAFIPTFLPFSRYSSPITFAPAFLIPDADDSVRSPNHSLRLPDTNMLKHDGRHYSLHERCQAEQLRQSYCTADLQTHQRLVWLYFILFFDDHACHSGR